MISPSIVAQLQAFGEQDASTGLSNWKAIESLMHNHPHELEGIIRWVFRYYPGLYDPRHHAGEMLRHMHEAEFWDTVQGFLRSSVMMDRDYGLDILIDLEETPEDNYSQIAIMREFAEQLLYDPSLFIRMKAAYYLQHTNAQAVKQALQRLLTELPIPCRSEAEQQSEAMLRASAATLLRSLV
jgi:hypothetical protein